MTRIAHSMYVCACVCITHSDIHAYAYVSVYDVTFMCLCELKRDSKNKLNRNDSTLQVIYIIYQIHATLLTYLAFSFIDVDLLM